jgi:hypothetical protein
MKTTLIKIFFFSAAVFFFQESVLCRNNHQETEELVEIFPLKPNLYFRYHYFYESSFKYTVTLLEQYDETGIIEYLVRDSIQQNDTTVTWIIEERYSLYNFIFNHNMGINNTYWTYDTLTLYLKEITTGKHEINLNSIIWNYPIISHANGNVLPVYRYADVDSILVTDYSDYGTDGYEFDSLLFVKSYGFLYRYESKLFDYGTGYSYKDSIAAYILYQPTRVTYSDARPKAFKLNQNYPNPFNSSTTINYVLPARSRVRLQVYNILGQMVTELINNEQSAGYQSVTWNANVASGMYFYMLEAVTVTDPSKSFVETKKMLLLK